MAGKAVFCISSSEAQASHIVRQLKAAGFASQHISALLPDTTGSNDWAHELHTKAPEGAVLGGLLGAATFGGLGWIAGVGTWELPGFAQAVAAGPLFAGLSGAGLGALSGGMLGAMVGAIIPEYEARRYRGKLGVGNILISVHCESAGLARQVRAIFRTAGAGGIATARERRVRRSSRQRVELGVG